MRSSLFQIVVGIFFVLGLNAVAEPQKIFGLQTTQQSAQAKSRKISGLKHVKQPDKISCGPTAAKMVLSGYHFTPAVSRLKQLAQTTWFSYKGEDFGLTHPGHLADAMDAVGLKSDWHTGISLDRIRQFVDEGRPPILLVRTGRELWHYVVVTGYDRGADIFNYLDPSDGKAHTIDSARLDRARRFSHDMSGNYIADLVCPGCKGGKHVWTKCVACGGSGWHEVGPLKTHCAACSGEGKWSSRCPLCSATGSVGDPHKKVVETAGVSGRSVIVPKKATPLASWVRGSRFSLSCVRNTLPIKVNYSFSWGSAKWENASIEANSWKVHYTPFHWIGEQPVHEFWLKFDKDLAPGNQEKEYRIKLYSVEATDVFNNKQVGEAFKYVNGNKGIDLFHQD